MKSPVGLKQQVTKNFLKGIPSGIQNFKILSKRCIKLPVKTQQATSWASVSQTASDKKNKKI
jgi:hypothetical protein